uniref:Uncharacterized protein n=1 Tax=Ignisphaera aggregans TaxID=334771 RepID=A0A7C5Z0R7_9CREN
MDRFDAVYTSILLVGGLAFLSISLYSIYIDRYIQALASFAIGLILLSSSIALFRELREKNSKSLNVNHKN